MSPADGHVPSATPSIDQLPSEVKSRIAAHIADTYVERAGLAHLAVLARVSRGWEQAVNPLLYRTFHGRLMNTDQLRLIQAKRNVHSFVETILVSLLDLCRNAPDDAYNISSVDFDFEQEMRDVEYDLALADTVGCFTQAHRLNIDTCIWASSYYRKSKYTLHALLSANANIKTLYFADVEHWEGMMLIAQFVRSMPGLEELHVHIKDEGQYRHIWNQEDFRWTTREHFTCVSMCIALAACKQLKRINFGEMTLAMTNPHTPARGFASQLEHITLGSQSEAGPIIYDMLAASAKTLRTLQVDIANLSQAHFFGKPQYFPALRSLTLISFDPDISYPTRLPFFAGSPIKYLVLDGEVDTLQAMRWMDAGELPYLAHLCIDVDGFVPSEVSTSLRQLCAERDVRLTIESWPLPSEKLDEKLEDFM